MTIYVDDMLRQATVPNGRKSVKSRWSHLFVDNFEELDELHKFARKIGLRRTWFQHERKYPHSPWMWHYDVTEPVRAKALVLGAKPCAYMGDTGRILREYGDRWRAADIEHQIERWHADEGRGMELHEWLGWTWEQYQAWGADATSQRILDKAPCRQAA